MDYEQIKYEVAEKILTITINRPRRLNAFTEQMKFELIDAFDRADKDDAVRVIIVTGQGRAFCAGMDLGEGGDTFNFKDREQEEGDHRDGGGEVALKIFESRKPVIAAINGAAVGVGITMTLAMDIRIAAENAKIGFVFSQRGIAPEACSTWFLPRLVGISRALEWVFTGRVFRAEEALEAGLVREVVPKDEVYNTAYKLAREIADNTSAISVALARQMMYRTLGAPHPMDGHRIESKALFAMGKSADAAEGVTSFLEKRPADFKMKPSTDMPDFYPWWEEPKFKP